MQRFELAKGIHFNMLPQTKFKTNFFQVSFVLNLERKNTTMLSLLTGVLMRGCSKYPDVASINNRLDYLYDTNASLVTYKRGERIVLCYESDFLKDDYVPEGSEKLLCESIDMFRQIVLRPKTGGGSFDEHYLELEKNQLEKEIKSIINNKNAYSKQKCIETLCQDEKYSLNTDGYVEDIPCVDGKKLYEFYKEVLEKAQIEVFFYGDGNAEEISKAFSEVFTEIENRCPDMLCETFVTDKVKEETAYVTEEMAVSQGKLAIGFRTGINITDSDAAALSLFCEIYGSSPVSKLFMNVREKLSLCYYCRSVIDSFKGIMLVLSGIESENKDKSLEAILKELEEIKKGNVTEQELESAKLSLLNGYKTLDDNPSAICSWYLSRITNGSFETPESVAQNIKNTTLSQVIEAAKKVKIDTVYFLKGTGAPDTEDEE